MPADLLHRAPGPRGVLKKLAKRSEKGLKLDAIVIETTGLADPAPVAQTFFVDDDVKVLYFRWHYHAGRCEARRATSRR